MKINIENDSVVLYYIIKAAFLCKKDFEEHKNDINHEYIINYWWPDLMLRLHNGMDIEDALGCVTISESRNMIKNLSKVYYLKFHGGFFLDRVLASFFPIDYKGVFVEVGAGHWQYDNNSLHFDKNGWKCYCFEPNPELFNEFLVNRPNTMVYNVAIGSTNADSVDFYIYNTDSIYGVSQMAVSSTSIAGNEMLSLNPVFDKKIQVKQMRLSDVLPRDIHIDVMTIDVENHEKDVLLGIDFDIHSPDIIVIENNNNINYEYLLNNNYRLIRRHNVNDIFANNFWRPNCYLNPRDLQSVG